MAELALEEETGDQTLCEKMASTSSSTNGCTTVLLTRRRASSDGEQLVALVVVVVVAVDVAVFSCAVLCLFDFLLLGKTTTADDVEL